jgi:hypothetical protein
MRSYPFRWFAFCGLSDALQGGQKTPLTLNPQAYLTDVLAKLVNGWPMKQLDALLPWAWQDQASGDKQAA